MRRKLIWIGGGFAVLAGGATVLFVLAASYVQKITPYIREQAVAYLRDRYSADVELGSLDVGLPGFSPVKLYISKGAGTLASVTGRDVAIRKDGQTLLKMRTMRFDVDLGRLFDKEKTVDRVSLDGIEIIIPPKGQRAALKPPKFENGPAEPRPKVVIREIVVSDAALSIMPRDPTRVPLRFDLYRVLLTDVGPSVPFRYEAHLRNAKPPGEITSKGSFGPWNKEEPGETPLSGDYLFERADLSVFPAIRGLLRSAGKFDGVLNAFHAAGEASVPDFALKRAGNAVPLYTRFEVDVDGTNGNTTMKPVHARLGKTNFVVIGGVIKHEGDRRRTTDLDVDMKKGLLDDILRLAMKGDQNFMTGFLDLKARLKVPPLSGKVAEKLQLNGRFTISEGKFLKLNLQDRIDKMSRQAQGQPNNTDIDEVVSIVTGHLDMANEVVSFHYLTFAIPGADMALEGAFNLDTEEIDFKGDIRLKAHLSETQTGWKRWALKPVDPFFAKKGAGTYSKITITGSRKDPHFARAK